MSILELSHVYKTYQNDRHALKNISFKADAGDFIFLTGHSGAGKSTLFKILSAQESATSGSVSVLGKDMNEYDHRNIHEYRREIGIIFQDFKLIPEITNRANLEIPLNVIGQSRKEMDEAVKQIIDLVGIKSSYLDEYPESLSGGEQQKIAVARAIIHRPKIIFADEPTGNLDKEASINILMILKELTKWQTTVLFATHDENLMSRVQSKSIHLKAGEIESAAGRGMVL
ncbi:cell division ATP-binding protein FtsE [Bdellovibrio sp. qaytius]|nr:cell division ATP-binding protein FtsE [Bdellovibrio sp. qaytius]